MCTHTTATTIACPTYGNPMVKPMLAQARQNCQCFVRGVVEAEERTKQQTQLWCLTVIHDDSDSKKHA